MSKDKSIIYGIRTIIEAVKAGKDIDKVIIANGIEGNLIRELKVILRENHINIQYVPMEKINAVTRSNHQGALAYLSMTSYQKIENLLPGIYENGETPLLIILDRITDVRNFGALVRTASCMGVHAVIIPETGAARIGPDAVKTSAGALHSVNICRHHNLKEVITYLKASGLQVIAASEKAAIPCYLIDMTLPTAIIMGSEEDGVSPEYLKMCSKSIFIPNAGKISSLNVSVAAGIILYEVVRQRTMAG